VLSQQSEGVDNNEGDEEQSQWLLTPFLPYPILMVAITDLIGNLKSCLPSMFCFYSILKSQHPEDFIT
jgi:hypothetical protein